jgi:glycerophosphoryl diester phosphodiesterase
MQSRFFEKPKPRIFAHRGASGTAPENTLAAFEKALEAGADYLEMDVHATSDGHIVVMHDPALDRTTNGLGPISALTLKELKKLDAGYRFTPDEGETFPYRGQRITVPTLRELVERFPGVPFNIEVKGNDRGNEHAVVELLKELKHDEISLLAAEKEEMMVRLRPVVGGFPTNFCDTESLEFIQRANQNEWDGYAPPGAALQIPEEFAGMTILTPELLEAAHGFGVEVHTWTVNDEDDMRRQLEMGVDGIMSDHPERLSKVVREMCLRPDLDA